MIRSAAIASAPLLATLAAAAALGGCRREPVVVTPGVAPRNADARSAADSALSAAPDSAAGAVLDSMTRARADSAARAAGDTVRARPDST